MINELYTATGGMMMQQKRMDVIASNLANISTVGHKKEVAVFSEYLPNPGDNPDDIIRNSDYNQMINNTARLHDVKVNFEQGYLRETGNELDMALGNPNAFFVVDTPFGVRFTRNGDFTTNDQGELVTMEGYPLVSSTENPQPIRLQEGAVITEDGDMLLDGAPIGAIGIVQFEDMTNLQKTGNNLYVAIDTLPDPAENPGLTTGYLEGSNVNPVEEMVRMIEASRAFETYSKIINTYDSLASKTATEVGKVS